MSREELLRVITLNSLELLLTADQVEEEFGGCIMDDLAGMIDDYNLDSYIWISDPQFLTAYTPNGLKYRIDLIKYEIAVNTDFSANSPDFPDWEKVE